ncbi:hypothetical protein PMI08_03145 [Brevibacillus sp. CF112]|uniref:hypothetical protein n=1 Tax=Brevibacillus sp. CF112 TaxID=1144311 RepID=UPI0002717F5F|nr:hypothetical protein [Brevibacillus sp. CF112]EJL42494.1 hypothetical protein PMI08_03145 [Brevibacillus sp. CF112]
MSECKLYPIPPRVHEAEEAYNRFPNNLKTIMSDPVLTARVEAVEELTNQNNRVNEQQTQKLSDQEKLNIYFGRGW